MDDKDTHVTVGPTLGWAIPKEKRRKDMAKQAGQAYYMADDLLKKSSKDTEEPKVEENIAEVAKATLEQMGLGHLVAKEATLKSPMPTVGIDEVREAMTKVDMVDQPTHYQIFPEFNLEAIDIILRVIQLSGLDGRRAYHLGNSLKYLLRIGRKGDVKEDAGKARHYTARLEDD